MAAPKAGQKLTTKQAAALAALIAAFGAGWVVSPAPAPAPVPVVSASASPVPPPVTPPPVTAAAAAPTAAALTEAAVKLTAGTLPNVARATLTGNQIVTGNLSNATVNGSVTIAGNGVTLTNVDISGGLYISGRSDVTVNNSRVTGGTWADGGARLRFYRDEFYNASGGPHMQVWTTWGTNARTQGLQIIESYFHDLLPYCPLGKNIATECGHTENAHIAGVDGVLIQHNSFDIRQVNPPVGITGDLVFEAGPFSSNVTVDGNWFHGSVYYQMYMIATGASSVTNNAFFSETGATPQYWGYTSSNTPGGVYPRFQQSGNTRDGQPVSLPGGIG